MNRRNFLQAAAASLGAGVVPALFTGGARAQSSGYRALVCIFLYGGNDSTNTLVPRDATRYAQYAAVRKHLALPASSLLPLNADLGLHPALAGLSAAWTEQALAPVFNVGPLFQPLTRAEYLNARALGKTVPQSLFSHHHQQLLWETSHHDASRRAGWGGRAAALRAGLVMSGASNSRFGLTEQATPVVFPAPGAVFGLQGYWGGPNAARRSALQALHEEASEQALHGAYARHQRDALALAEQLGPILRINPKDHPGEPINPAFASVTDAAGRLTTDLARQLYQIAKLIGYRASLPPAVGQASGHLYFAALGGFDTHGNQVGSDALNGDHAGLLRTLGDAMGAFYQATKALGVAGQVTTFTQSDFGRTFMPNASRGTDHGWGGHQLVMGGSVAGQATYGTYPTLVLGGPDDAGGPAWEQQGRWIPSASVEQYAATLLRWWGLDETQLSTLLPNLVNFGSARSLGFLRA